MAIEMGIKDVDIYGDSPLVIKQLLEHKKEDLISYHIYALRLLNRLGTVKLEHVPRSANKMADALANLACTLALKAEENMYNPVCNRWVILTPSEEFEEDVNAVNAQEVDEEDWRHPFIDYLQHGKLPNYLKHKTKIQRRAPRFLYLNGTLYRCSLLLRCLDKEEARQTMEESHLGVCGAH